MSTTATRKQSLYYIALLPDPDLQEEINTYKAIFAETYGSKAAFRSPPHITLHMPFTLKPSKENSLIDLLTAFSSKQNTFEVTLQNFGAFAPRVVYIGVADNLELGQLQLALSKDMRKYLNIFNADYKQRGFNPHITIAFRDLKKAAFEMAWPVFQEKAFDASFIAEQITLLKHNGKSWDVFESFKFCGV